MKGRLSLYLVLAGTITLLIGINITATLIVDRENCDRRFAQRRVPGIREQHSLGVPILGIGIARFIAAGLSVTTIVLRRGREAALSVPSARISEKVAPGSE